MRFFIYPTHLDSREHVVIATLLNGMKNVLSSMKEVHCHIHLDSQNADSGKRLFTLPMAVVLYYSQGYPESTPTFIVTTPFPSLSSSSMKLKCEFSVGV